MEKFQLLRDKAGEKIKLADHMLFMTYPLVKDPKFLLAIIENIFTSLDCGIGAVLHHERLFKQIPPFHDSFNSRYEIFRSQIIPKHNLNTGYIKLIKDVRQLLAERKTSPMEFSRKDKFVICSKDYHLKTIDVNLVKKYIFETKIFVKNIEKIVSKNEGIFIRR